jgi:hypothetical protein
LKVTAEVQGDERSDSEFAGGEFRLDEFYLELVAGHVEWVTAAVIAF